MNQILPIRRYRHAEGFNIALVEQPTWQRMLIRIVIPLGSCGAWIAAPQPPMGIPIGAAHLLEHLLSKQLAATFGEQSLTQYHALTSWWTTQFNTWTTKLVWSELEHALEVLCSARFDQEWLQHEQQIISHEIRQRDAQVKYQLYRTMLETLYQQHPIRYGVTGTVADLAKISLTELQALHQAFYQPQYMTLWLAGPSERLHQLDRSGWVETPPNLWMNDQLPDEPAHPRLPIQHIASNNPQPALRIAYKDQLTIPWLERRLTSELVLEGLLGLGSPLGKLRAQGEYSGDNYFGYSAISASHSQPQALADLMQTQLEHFAMTLDQPRLGQLKRHLLLRYAIRYEQPEQLLSELQTIERQQTSLDHLYKTLATLDITTVAQRIQQHFIPEYRTLIVAQHSG